MARALSSGYDDGSNTNARRVVLDTTSFTNNLSDNDITVQDAMEKLDQLTPDLSSRVPYAGANQDVNIDGYSIFAKGLGTKKISLTGARRGSALQFNGTNAYVSFETNLYSQGIRGQATFSLWVYPVSGDSSSAILGDWANILGRDAGFGIQYLSTDNTLKFLLRPDSRNTITVEDGIQPNVWSHVVGVLDKANSKMKLYVNGVKIGETTLYNDIGNSYRYVRLGTFSDWGVNTYFKGSIDEVMIWDRALSEEEISKVYNSGIGETADISESPYNLGLLNGYHLDEGTGNQLHSIVSGNLTGLISFAYWIPGYVPIEDTTKKLILKDNQLKLDDGVWVDTNKALHLGEFRDSKISYDGNDLHINPKVRGTGKLIIDGEIQAQNVVGYIPYVGSNQNVDLDTYNLSAKRVRSPYFDIRGERVGNAVVFNGSTSYVQMNTNTIPKGTNFTFSVWVKPSALDSTYDGVFTTQNASGGSAFSIVRNGGNNFFTINYPQVGGALSFPAVEVGVWHFYSVVRNGSYIYGYFDGELIGTREVSGAETEVDTKMRYGTYRVRNEHYFQGALEESTIFNRALSQAEIKTMYNGGKGLYCNPSIAPYNSGLVGAYRWTSGATVYDLVASNNGTLSNCSYTTGLIEANVGQFKTIKLEDSHIQPTANIWLLDNVKQVFGDGKEASIKYDGTNLVINPKEVGSGAVEISGYIKASYKSSDGTAGLTTTKTFDDKDGNSHEVIIKDGLITAWNIT